MKKCNKCGKLKKETEFGKDSYKKDKLKDCCKKCRNVNQKNYFMTKEGKKYHKEYQVKYQKKLVESYGIGARTIYNYGLKLSLFVYDRAERKCEICKNINNLTIHHKDHKGSNYKKKGLEMNNHPDNLIILCNVCHGRLHATEYWKNKKRDK